MKRALIRVSLLLFFIGVFAPLWHAQVFGQDGIFNVKNFGAQGNGVADDYLSIKNAMDAAAQVRGTVYFPPGTYMLSSPLRPGADVTLLGAGRKAAFLKATRSYPDTGIMALVEVKAPAHRVQVRDLGFLSNGNNFQAIWLSSVQDVIVERCWFDGGFWWSVFIGESSRNCRVVNIISEGTYFSHNVEINDSSYCEVSDSYLRNANLNGVEVYQKTAGESVGNRIVRNNIDGAKANGVALLGDRQTLVMENVITRTGGSAIRGIYSEILGVDYPSTAVKIIGNTLVDNGLTGVQHGISLDRGTLSWTVKGNSIKGSGNCGIYIGGREHIIDGNIIFENQGHGIYAHRSGSGHILSNNSCINNSLIAPGSRDGIIIEASNCSITANRCTDTRSTKLQRYGVLVLTGANNNTLTANLTSGNLNGGLLDLGTGNVKTGNK